MVSQTEREAQQMMHTGEHVETCVDVPSGSESFPQADNTANCVSTSEQFMEAGNLKRHMRAQTGEKPRHSTSTFMTAQCRFTKH